VLGNFYLHVSELEESMSCYRKAISWGRNDSTRN